jgi:hypothetical protein
VVCADLVGVNKLEASGIFLGSGIRVQTAQPQTT